MRATFVSIASLLLMFTSSNAQFEVFEEYLNDPSAAERKFKQIFREEKQELLKRFKKYKKRIQSEEPDVAQEEEDRDVVSEGDVGTEDDVTVGLDATSEEYGYANCGRKRENFEFGFRTGNVGFDFVECTLCEPRSKPCGDSRLIYLGPIDESQQARDRLFCGEDRRCIKRRKSNRTVVLGNNCIFAERHKKKCLDKFAKQKRGFEQHARRSEIWEFRIAKGNVKQAELDEIERQRQEPLRAERAERERQAQAERQREIARQVQDREAQQEPTDLYPQNIEPAETRGGGPENQGEFRERNAVPYQGPQSDSPAVISVIFFGLVLAIIGGAVFFLWRYLYIRSHVYEVNWYGPHFWLTGIGVGVFFSGVGLSEQHSANATIGLVFLVATYLASFAYLYRRTQDAIFSAIYPPSVVAAALVLILAVLLFVSQRQTARENRIRREASIRQEARDWARR